MLRQLVSLWIRADCAVGALVGAKEVSPMVTAEHARPCCQRRGVRVTTVEPRPYKSTLVSCGNMRDCYATAVRKACWLWFAGFSHGDYHLDEAKSEVV